TGHYLVGKKSIPMPDIRRPADPTRRLTVRGATDPAGVPVEWSEDRYLPGTIAFTVHNSVATSTLGRRHSPRTVPVGTDGPSAA
ncbi:hypothetical protein ABZS62_21425, partial [Streptomyces sp900116325]